MVEGQHASPRPMRDYSLLRQFVITLQNIYKFLMSIWSTVNCQSQDGMAKTLWRLGLNGLSLKMKLKLKLKPW